MSLTVLTKQCVDDLKLLLHNELLEKLSKIELLIKEGYGDSRRIIKTFIKILHQLSANTEAEQQAKNVIYTFLQAVKPHCPDINLKQLLSAGTVFEKKAREFHFVGQFGDKILIRTLTPDCYHYIYEVWDTYFTKRYYKMLLPEFFTPLRGDPTLLTEDMHLIVPLLDMVIRYDLIHKTVVQTYPLVGDRIDTLTIVGDTLTIDSTDSTSNSFSTHEINSYDLSSGELLHTYKRNRFLSGNSLPPILGNIIAHPNGKHMIMDGVTRSGLAIRVCIQIWDPATGELVSQANFKTKQYILKIRVLNKKQLYVHFGLDKNPIVIDSHSLKVLYELNYKGDQFYPINDEYFAVLDSRYVGPKNNLPKGKFIEELKVFHTTTGKCIVTINKGLQDFYPLFTRIWMTPGGIGLHQYMIKHPEESFSKLAFLNFPYQMISSSEHSNTWGLSDNQVQAALRFRDSVDEHPVKPKESIELVQFNPL